jgi:hypothetical protein
MASNAPRTSADDKSRQTSPFKSALGYLSIVGRELRDVPTGFATGVIASFERKGGAQPGSKRLQELVDNDTRANWNARKQYKEAFQSFTGQKGTRSDEIQNGKYINKTPKKK